MIKVILVEDDSMVRSINKRFLEKLNYFDVIAEAQNIEEAKSILKIIETDLILLDVFLPDGKGLDLLKWIRLNGINADAILVTADKGKTSVDEAFKYGAVDYLIKPFKFERFSEALLKYRDRHNSFKDLIHVNQESIDEYILERSIENKSSYLNKEDEDRIDTPKGISCKTYKRIINFMKMDKDKRFTAEEIASGSGLARVTARRYLESMVKEGKVEVVQEYGRIGRPTNFYFLK